MFTRNLAITIGGVLLVLTCVLLLVQPVSAQSAVQILTAPPNDDFANAQGLVLNKRTATTGALSLASLEVLETTDPDLQHCAMYATVWYKFTPQFTGEMALSTAGSHVYWIDPYPFYSVNTVIAVYTGAALDLLAEVGCNDDNSELLAEIPALPVTAGKTYTVRVGLATSIPPEGGVFKVIAAITKSPLYDPVNVQNREFDESIDVGWTLTDATNGDGRVCTSYCEFKFVGGPDEATRLAQTRLWPSGTLLARDGHMLGLDVYVRTVPTADLKIQLVILYADGTPPTKTKLVIREELHAFVRMCAFFESPNVRKVKLIFVNRAASGSDYIDSIGLDYNAGLVRERALAFPLPPAK